MKIRFYPDRPIGHKINSIIGRLGWELSNDADVIFWWNYSSYYKPIPKEFENKLVINRNALDTTKQFIDKHFGEHTLVNPEKHKGKVVRKFEINRSHDNEVIECPTPYRTGHIYQQILEQKEGNLWFDYRVAWCFGQIPFVFKKYKKTMLPDGLNEHIVKVDIVDTSVFSNEFLKRFRDKMSFCDYGEADVLCEKVIDVNLIPSANMLKYIDKELYVNKISQIFDEFIKSKTNG